MQLREFTLENSQADNQLTVTSDTTAVPILLLNVLNASGLIISPALPNAVQSYAAARKRVGSTLAG